MKSNIEAKMMTVYSVIQTKNLFTGKNFSSFDLVMEFPKDPICFPDAQ
jgi:hypothetical protein